MKKILGLALSAFLFSCTPAIAQEIVLPCVQIPGTGVSSCAPVTSSNPLPIAVYDAGNHSGYCYTSNGSASAATFQACGGGGGSGTVTSVSVATANGFSGTVANPTTTPAITIIAGAITPTSVNGLTVTTSTGTVTIANGKTLTDSNTLTFTGTDGSSVNFGAGGTVLYGNQTITLTGPVTGSGTTSITTTIGANQVTLTNLAQSAANTMLGNWTGSTANVTANTMPACAADGAHALTYTNGTGVVCTAVSGGGGTITLGTSAAATNPQRSSEAGTGFYSLNSGEIDAALAGNQALLVSATTSSNILIGYEALNAVTTGNTNTAVGFKAGVVNTTGSQNTFIGYEAGLLNAGASANVYIGYLAASGQNLNSGNNVMIGANLTGGNNGNGNNTCVGEGAGCSNASSSAFGQGALAQATLATMIGQGGHANGVSSTVVGENSATGNGSSFTTVIGAESGTQNITGVDNTLLGSGQGGHLTGGTNNTIIGFSVGTTTLATGSSNILIGNSSAVDVVSSSTAHNLNIGNLLQGDMTNSTALGTEALFLQSTSSGVDYVTITSGVTGNPGSATISAVGSDTNVNMDLALKGSGAVNIGTTTSVTGALLAVNGGIAQTTATSCTTGVQTNSVGLFSACVASDKNLKKNIEYLPYDPSIILKLKPVAYAWKDPSIRDDKTHMGFIAQDVEAVIPDAVVSAGKDTKGLDSNALIAALTLEVQSLRKRLDADEKLLKH